MTTLLGDDGRQGALVATLEPGERLRWSGIPQSSGGAATFLPGCGGLIFLLIGLVGLGIGWGSTMSDFAAARRDAPLWLTVGAALTLVALGLLVTPFVWRARVRRRSCTSCRSTTQRCARRSATRPSSPTPCGRRIACRSTGRSC